MTGMVFTRCSDTETEAWLQLLRYFEVVSSSLGNPTFGDGVSIPTVIKARLKANIDDYQRFPGRQWAVYRQTSQGVVYFTGSRNIYGVVRKNKGYLAFFVALSKKVQDDLEPQIEAFQDSGWEVREARIRLVLQSWMRDIEIIHRSIVSEWAKLDPKGNNLRYAEVYFRDKRRDTRVSLSLSITELSNLGIRVTAGPPRGKDEGVLLYVYWHNGRYHLQVLI